MVWGETHWVWQNKDGTFAEIRDTYELPKEPTIVAATLDGAMDSLCCSEQPIGANDGREYKKSHAGRKWTVWWYSFMIWTVRNWKPSVRVKCPCRTSQASSKSWRMNFRRFWKCDLISPLFPMRIVMSTMSRSRVSSHLMRKFLIVIMPVFTWRKSLNLRI